MDARSAQNCIVNYLKELFGKDNVYNEWKAKTGAKDWLKFDHNIYAPRPDIAVGPLNIEEGRNIQNIESVFTQYQQFFKKLKNHKDNINYCTNSNPRCLIAIEIENSNKGKHMLGNIINASILGKIGIIVTLKKDFYEDAKRICKYLEGAFKVEKSEHDPSNVIVIEYEDLKKILFAICSSEHNNA